MNNKFKNLILYSVVIIFVILITVKYAIGIIENKIIDIVKSERFDEFVIKVLDTKLEQLSKYDLDYGKKQFYKEKIIIIKEKYKDIFE
jgi:hypothetical protein